MHPPNTRFASSPEHTAPIADAQARRDLGQTAIDRPGRHRAPEERIDVPLSYSDGVVGRHRRTAGRLAYAAARETGDAELIKTGDRLVRREDGGDPTSAADIETFAYLINLAGTQPAPDMPTLANLQDFMMPRAQLPSTSEVLYPKNEAYTLSEETTLYPEDFHNDPEPILTQHQAGTRDLNLPTDNRQALYEPTHR